MTALLICADRRGRPGAAVGLSAARRRLGDRLSLQPGRRAASQEPNKPGAMIDRHTDADQFDVRTPTMSGPFDFRTASVQ